MARRSPAFALALWLAWAARAGAQEPEAREHVERGLAAASAGDTAAALVELKLAIQREPDWADAHYQLGRLYVSRASAKESDFRDRMEAQRALERALQLDPGNPLYLLELGKLKLKQHMRVDALRLFKRSLDRAKDLGDPEVLAEVHYQIGRIYELWYEGLRYRRMTPLLREAPATESWQHPNQTPSEYINDYLDDAPEIEDSGWLEKDIMMEHYRAALRANPAHVEAATHLLGVLYDDDRFTEYLAIAEPLAHAVPDRAEPHLFLGLGYHAVGRVDEAAAEFRRGLALLPEEDRAAIQSLAPVLRRKEAQLYESLDASARRAFEERYWAVTDPLYLTEANERWIEHVARAAYADLRFSAPEAGLRGWETDRGIIYIRYGKPERIGVFAAEPWAGTDPYRVGSRTITWTYGPNGPTFVFQQRLGYRNARFAGEYAQRAQDWRHVVPALYRYPSIPVVFSVPVQIARFRGAAPDESVVEVYAGIPVDSLFQGVSLRAQEVETGFFLLDARGEMRVRRVQTTTLTPDAAGAIRGLRTWRLVVPPDSFYYVGVEARDPLSWRTATARDTFTVARFEPGRLQLSDIVLADFLHPRVENPVDRADLEIRPNPRMAYEVGAPVHLVYEIYDLETDETGFAVYDVNLAVRVLSLQREGGFAQLLGMIADAWGFTIVGDDRVEVSFTREVRLEDRDRAVGWYSIDLRDAPPGEYEIRIRITDRQTGQTAERSRRFRVLRPEVSE